MVKSSLFAALVSLLAYTTAQVEDDDDCDPDEDITSSTMGISASSSSLASACPSLPAPTTTETVSRLTAVATEFQVTPVTTTVFIATVTSTAAQPTDQTDVTFITQTVAAATETVFTGSTFTSVAFSVVPAETTITVPRRADFTPIKCESAYVGPFSTTSFSYTSTVYTYPVVSTFTSESTTTSLVFPSPLIFPSVTGDFTTTITLQPTTTVTSIRDDPTSTVYAACQGTDNVTPDAPPSYYPYIGPPASVPGTYSSVVAAIDQVDCCALCQADERCTASSFYTKPVIGIGLDTYLVGTACQLFLKNDTTSATCDPSLVGADMTSDYTFPVIYYSNGPCGQFNFSSVYYRSRFVWDHPS